MTVTFTAPRGESWRCQVICASGRRCTWSAVWEAVHPVHQVTIRACTRHKRQLDAGATIRVNSSLGVDTKPATIQGGPFDGDTIGVPIDLRAGDQWFMEVEGGTTHLHVLQPGDTLVHQGPREDTKPITADQAPA